MKKLRPKIVKLAKTIGGFSGIMNKIDENAPEYYVFADILTDEEADVAIAAGLRKSRTVQDLVDRVDMPYEKVKEISDRLSWIGVFRVNYDKELKEDVYFLNIFAPGILENMVNNDELLKMHPEVGRAFNEYTDLRIATLAPALPNGYGLMRVVPIESSIEEIEDVEDFDRISHYLDIHDTFAVSNCSCRASRRTMNEGCGHLEEDMCLFLGHAAESYIRTGKGRQVSREEAKAIIKRAEENGLMHNMPNIDGPGESVAICNCCVCSCFGLRGGMLYGARDAIRSNFVAEIDESKCVACGQCVETCPANALKLGQKIETIEPLEKEEPYRKMRDSIWHKSDWNVDYRENHTNVVHTGTAPCKAACPAHIAVQGYLKLASEGKYTKALELIKKENPFPAVCGRICDHRCEMHCTRANVDEAVAIDEVKRFIADHDLSEETRFIPPMINQIGKNYPQKIAIIGAGPAGMTCAFFLAQKGYKPTVFEKESKPGGMLMNGIPSFRLEKDVLTAEINILKEMGVEFVLNTEVGKDISIDELRKQGYQGFYIAIGAQGGRKLGIKGEDSKGVYSGVDFLKKVNLNQHESLKGDILVIGGGNVAIDVARVSVREDVNSVKLFCLESEENMPADINEIDEAKREDIQINSSWGPHEIISENGKVRGVRFKRCISVIDEEGKFNPQFDLDNIIEVKCDAVLVAVGQSVIWGNLLSQTNIELNENGTIRVNSLTYESSEMDIFAGGDVVTGPKFAIDAIAAGKEGAISLHRSVHPGQTQNMGRNRHEYLELDRKNVVIPKGSFDDTARQQPGYNGAKAKTYGDVRITFTEEQVKQEASRCLKCGAAKVDSYLCIGCGLCTTRCEFDAVHMKKAFDWRAAPFEKMPIKVAGHVLKKAGKIIAKPIVGSK